MNKEKLTALILLDVFAAFDTMDHKILCHQFEHCFSLSGPALNYLHSSVPTVLNCDVPQGSVLGSLLFTLHSTPLGSLLTNSALDDHLYAGMLMICSLPFI